MILYSSTSTTWNEEADLITSMESFSPLLYVCRGTAKGSNREAPSGKVHVLCDLSLDVS